MTQANGIFLQAADSIGARLCRDALWAGERCNWLGDSMEFVSGRWMVAHRAFGPELYSGTSGVALFLARLFALTNERLFRATAEGGINQALSRMEDVGGAGRIGFYTGQLGIAYAAIRIGEIFDNQALLERGMRIVEDLSQEKPDEHALDVLAGSAGAIPVLLQLGRQHPKKFMLELAVRHGEFLLGAARRSASGWSWNTLNIPPEQRQQDLNGFSHGTGGIAWALLELHRATGQEKFRVAAEQGFLYERQWFNPEQGNWPDFRGLYDRTGGGDGKPGYMTAWCHGAPGIGLARLRAYAITGDATYRGEAEAALQTTGRTLSHPAYLAQGNYCLCHGHGGNAELLIYGSNILGNVELKTLAEQVGRQGIESYQKTFNPWPCGVLEGGETPSLMLGLAGIGYFYLRLHDPVNVPPILIILPD